MQYFDTPDPKRLVRAITALALSSLTLLIIVLALNNNNGPADQVTPPPHGATPPLVDNLNVVEQQIPLVDGRTVLCLFFTNPTHQIVCDWATARATR